MSQTISNDYINMINKKGSGYNIPVIVDAIVSAEIDPLRTQVTNKIEKSDATISGLASMKASAQASKTVIDTFDASLSFALTSSKTASLTITSKNDGELSSFSKSITGIMLAKPMTFTVSNYNRAAVFGAQTLTVRNFANAVIGTVIVAAGETVAAVAGKLDRVAGIKAELVDSGSGTITPDVLSITSDLGQANNFTISSTVAADKIVTSVGDVRILAARDASLVMDGVPITRPSNDITDLVKGANVKLLADDIGPITIASTLSSAGVMATVKELMAELNLYKADLDALGFVDTAGGEDGVLAQNAYLRNAQTQFARFMAKPLMGYISNNVENVPVYFVEFGIKTTKAGTFEFDKTTFDQTFAREPEKFAALAVDRAYSSDPNVTVTATAASTIPTGAHNYNNHFRTAQRAGRAHLQSGDYQAAAGGNPAVPAGGAINNPVHATRLTYTVQGDPRVGRAATTGFYDADGTESLATIAARWNPTDGVTVTHNGHTGRLNFTWTRQDPNDTNPAPFNEQGDDVTVTSSNALRNDVTGVAQQKTIGGFSGSTHVLPQQTINYAVTTDGGGTTNRSITTNPGETIGTFAARLNGLGHGISVSFAGTTLTLAASNPATAYSFTIGTINSAIGQISTIGGFTGSNQVMGAETIAYQVFGSAPSSITTSGTETVGAFAARLNGPGFNGISASFTGNKLTLTATNPATAHSFTFNRPSNTVNLTGPTTVTTGSASGTSQLVTANGNRQWANKLVSVDIPGSDESFDDRVTGNADFIVQEAQPGGSGVYNTPKYTGFQFVTTNDQIDMIFYVARSAKTELSRFFKDALSTTGIYRTIVDAYTDQSSSLAKRLDSVDERKLELQARYTEQFAAMETVVTGNSSTSEYITSLVAGWNKD